MSTESESANPTFSDLALSGAVLKAIAETGYETPTPIQQGAIPALLAGRDLLGTAQTGSGKTAAFALPVLSRIEGPSKNPTVLCLAPTRELAIQVAEAFQSYARHIKGFHVAPVYGGADYRQQIRQLKHGVNVVVGTPGRIMDHIRRGTLCLDDINTLILDEADEMLRMGFIDDVEWILEQMPDTLQTALFSATMPPRIRKITQKYLQDPAEVMIKQKTTTAASIRQRYLLVNHREKLDTLTRLLDVEEFDGLIIFVRTRNATQEISERLQARGYAAQALNGDIPQAQREKTVNRLKKGDLDILIATDVAARGLDVERITHVVNFDAPYDAESYVHRIGRTGRAGREGDAVLLITPREKRMLQTIERATRQRIERYAFPSLAALNERKLEKLFSRIDNELLKNLDEYEEVIRQYLQHNEVSPLLLAAAMTSLEYDSQPFYLKDKPKLANGRKKPDGEKVTSDRARSNRQDRRQKGKSQQNEPMQTYRIEAGEQHGVRRGDIVGAIANEAGIDSEYIGRIEIGAESSTVELPEGMPKSIYRQLRKTWIRGRQMKLTLTSSGPQRPAPTTQRRPPRKGKPSVDASRRGKRQKRS